MKKVKKEKNINTLALLTLILYFILIGIGFYKYFTTNDILSAKPEIMILLIVSILYLLRNIFNGKNSEPRHLNGDKLPQGKTKKEKNMRIRSYLLEALFLTMIFTYCQIETVLYLNDYNSMFNITIFGMSIITFQLIADLVIGFLISFGLGYWLNEYSVNKKNKK